MTRGRKPAAPAPTIRLVANGHDGRNDAKAHALGPHVRLAHVPGAQGDNSLMGRNGVEQLPDQSKPALLVSFFYIKPFLENKHRYAYRDWVLDSGAFSAHASGKAIDLQEFIEKSKELLATDPTLTEVFALDVIGDWKATAENCDKIWAAGVPAIPCYHVGSPETELKRLARDYPKIALGGAVGFKGKDAWAQQCFARVWPKKIHGFGFGGETSLFMLPWHSVDATNWEMGPCAFGNWKAFGKMSVRGSKQNLRAEVEHYLKLERRARQRWAKEMALLESLPAPTVRLAVASQHEAHYSQPEQRYVGAFGTDDAKKGTDGK